MLVYKRSHMIKKGISLVELMVLVLILAILSSVVFPHIRGMFRRSHEAKVKSNMFALKIATENFSFNFTSSEADSTNTVYNRSESVTILTFLAIFVSHILFSLIFS